MAQLFQPMLNQVAAPTHINPGIQDNSSAMLIAGLGGQAVEAWKGYEAAQLEAKQEEEMAAFAGYRTTPSNVANIQSLEEDVIRADVALQQQWGGQEATLEGVNSAEKVFTDAQAKLTSALREGRISSDQFNMRMMSNLREAINRNPGFEKEYVSQTQRLMEYSGMSSLLKQIDAEQIAMQKAAEERIKQEDYVLKLYPDLISGVTAGAISREDGVAKAAQRSRYDQAIVGIEQRAKEMKAKGELKAQVVDEVLQRPETRQVLLNTAPMAYRTLVNSIESGEFIKTAQQAGRNITPDQANIEGIRMYLQSRKGWLQDARMATNNPNSHHFIDSQLEELNNLEKLMVDGATDKYKLDAAKRRYELAETTMKYNTLGTRTKLEIYNLFSSAVGNFERSFQQAIPTDQVDQLVGGLFTDFIDWANGGMVGVNPASAIDLDTKAGQLAASGLYGLTDPEKSTFGDTPEQVIQNNSSRFAKSLQSLDTLDPKKKSEQLIFMMDKVLASMAGAKKPISAFVDQPTLTKFKQYMGDTFIASIGEAVLGYDEAANKITVTGGDVYNNDTASENLNKMLILLASTDGGTIDDVKADRIGKQLVDAFKRATPQATTAPAQGAQVAQNNTTTAPATTPAPRPALEQGNLRDSTAGFREATASAGNILTQAIAPIRDIAQTALDFVQAPFEAEAAYRERLKSGKTARDKGTTEAAKGREVDANLEAVYKDLQAANPDMKDKPLVGRVAPEGFTPKEQLTPVGREIVDFVEKNRNPEDKNTQRGMNTLREKYRKQKKTGKWHPYETQTLQYIIEKYWGEQ
jgi:hypothetical protein